MNLNPLTNKLKTKNVEVHLCCSWNLIYKVNYNFYSISLKFIFVVCSSDSQSKDSIQVNNEDIVASSEPCSMFEKLLEQKVRNGFIKSINVIEPWWRASHFLWLHPQLHHLQFGFRLSIKIQFFILSGYWMTK